MEHDKQTEFIRFLEKKKEELYRLQNQNPKQKTTKAKLELLEEVYKFYGFKSSSNILCFFKYLLLNIVTDYRLMQLCGYIQLYNIIKHW